MQLPLDNHDLLLLGWAAIRALIILLVALVAGRLLRTYLMRQGMRKRMNVNVAALGGNLAQVGLLALAIVIILPIFGVDWTALVTLVGAVGLAVSLAFQDLLRNFIAGIYILIERPFNLGDKITVQTSPEITGTVQSIELRITTVRTEDGVLVVIPNNTLFSTPVTNHSAVNLQRDVIRLSLSNADLGGVRPRINDVLRAFPDVAGNPGPSITVEEASPTTLKLRVEFWTPPHLEATVTPQIILALRQAFPSAEITVVS
jgi:small conductance mechanosensitive channel